MPGVEQLVAGVELAELAHNGHRHRAQLGGVRRELGFARRMAPQQREGGGILPGHGQERPGAESRVRRHGQFRAQLHAEVVEDLLEDLPVELLLRPEVPVDDQLGDPAGRGHVLHGGVGESGRGECQRSPVQDGGTPLGSW